MTSTSISPDMMDDFRAAFVSLLPAANKAMFKYRRGLKVHNTKEDYLHDRALRIDAIRTIQRDLHRSSPPLALNLVQVAYLLQMDYKSLCGYKISETLELITAVEPFVKSCLGRADEFLRPNTARSNGDSGDNSKAVAVFRILHTLHRDLWQEIRKIICNLDSNDEPIVAPFDGDSVKFPYPVIYPLLNNTWIGFVSANDTPRQQSSFNSLKDSICMEWRYLPRRIPEAFAGPEGEGSKFLTKKPSLGKSATCYKADVNHPELASFFERNMHDNGRGGGVPLSSGRRFLIQIQRKDTDNIIHLLEMMAMAFRICTFSRLAEFYDYFRNLPVEEWEGAMQAMGKKKVDRNTE